MKPIKHLEFKLCAPGLKRPLRNTMHAPNGKAFTASGVENIITALADRIEKQFPADEFRLVPIGRGKFNFVHAGQRAEYLPASSTATL